MIFLFIKEFIKLKTNMLLHFKCFMISESVYYNDFWRSCDTEDWRNDAEYSALIIGIKYIWQYINTENSCFNL